MFYGSSPSEARQFTGGHVFIVGGANSAGQAAVHLARYAASVTLVCRGASLSQTMSQYLLEEIRRQGEHLRAPAHPGGRRFGHRAAREPDAARPGRRRDRARGRALHPHRRRGANRLAARGDRAGRPRVRRDGAGLRHERSRRVRDRRRTSGIRQARRVGGGRGLGRHPARAPVPRALAEQARAPTG